MPSGDVREKDKALNEDIKWLTAALGRVIRRLEGDRAFEAELGSADGATLFRSVMDAA